MTIEEVSDEEEKKTIKVEKKRRPEPTPSVSVPAPSTLSSPSSPPLGPPTKRSKVVDAPHAAAAPVPTPSDTKTPAVASSSSASSAPTPAIVSDVVRCMVDGCNGLEGSRAARAGETTQQGVARIQAHYAWMLTNAPTQAADDGAHRKALLSLHRMLRSPTTCPDCRERVADSAALLVHCGSARGGSGAHQLLFHSAVKALAELAAVANDRDSDEYEDALDVLLVDLLGEAYVLALTRNHLQAKAAQTAKYGNPDIDDDDDDDNDEENISDMSHDAVAKALAAELGLPADLARLGLRPGGPIPAKVAAKSAPKPAATTAPTSSAAPSSSGGSSKKKKKSKKRSKKPARK